MQSINSNRKLVEAFGGKVILAIIETAYRIAGDVSADTGFFIGFAGCCFSKCRADLRPSLGDDPASGPSARDDQNLQCTRLEAINERRNLLQTTGRRKNTLLLCNKFFSLRFHCESPVVF